MMKYHNKIKILYLLCAILLLSLFTSCTNKTDYVSSESVTQATLENDDITKVTADDTQDITQDQISETDDNPVYTVRKIYVDFKAPYATYSIINDGYANLYELDKKKTPNYKNKTIAVNAGHGTKGGTSIKTFAHPDFTPKVSGGTNVEGSILSAAVSAGMTFKNGMTEANANLVVAYELKDKLLAAGYSVLMIRENDDARLDNIARTVIANENADAHIAIHFDSTDNDKGIFYITPYNDASYLNMEPVKSNANNIRLLGKSIIDAFREMGEKIWKDKGTLQGDLTQISFSTNASVDIELGDRKTELTKEKAETFAEGIKRGIDKYFGY